ncbi:hypothetical protein [Chitinophaga arvensicola]|uniref:Lipocalin-like domain-containing protein n=1 Tax=Chitinophaga arvensicola TaxID=29529 RepID=A0A1I0RRV1_9BACT|nr:hypothetical protein [Chitinophaga arvensicola]SEW44079.1 hypothetical protein SAMN04488122_3292 [Chitinophaga arvensicola]
MQIRNWLPALTTCVMLISACSRNNDDQPQIDTSAPSKGSWKVTLFSERGENNTNDFNGYTFTFNSNGTAVAAKGGVEKSGSWSFGNARYNIDFGAKGDGNKPLGELTDDWVIISINDTQIKLKDDNDNSQEQLVFTKN